MEVKVVIAFLFGVFLEVVVFSRHEWDRRAPRAAFAFCLLFASVFITLKAFYGYSYFKSMLHSSVLASVLLTGLFSSMIAYRLFFHPLKRFPGPLAARVTALWVVKENIPDLLFYRKLRTLHQKYDDFVRISKCSVQKGPGFWIGMTTRSHDLSLYFVFASNLV